MGYRVTSHPRSVIFSRVRYSAEMPGRELRRLLIGIAPVGENGGGGGETTPDETQCSDSTRKEISEALQRLITIWGKSAFVCSLRRASRRRIRGWNAREFSDGSSRSVCRRCSPPFAYLDAIKLPRLISIDFWSGFVISARACAHSRGVWTHVMAPGNLVNPGIGPDVALEVNVDTLPNSARIQIAAKLEGNHRLVWKQNRHQSSARNAPIWGSGRFNYRYSN